MSVGDKSDTAWRQRIASDEARAEAGRQDLRRLPDSECGHILHYLVGYLAAAAAAAATDALTPEAAARVLEIIASEMDRRR